jgi:hypothetical protein
MDKAGMISLLRGHDAVISSVRFVEYEAAHLIGVVRDSGVKRYLVVGGAGSLEVKAGLLLNDTPDYPPAARPNSVKGWQFLVLLRQQSDLEWTFICPSAKIFPGKRTGRFRIGGDQLLVGPDGSRISYEDYAVALVDELENPKHVRRRFTVGY